MKLDLAEIVKSTAAAGKKFWVCDYRKVVGMKAIRNVPPQEIMVLVDKDYIDAGKTPPRVYYSEVIFCKLNKKGEPKLSSTISPYDTTGYRYYTGVGVNLFDNEQECIDFYNDQVQVVLDAYDIEIELSVERLRSERNEINQLKVKK